MAEIENIEVGIGWQVGLDKVVGGPPRRALPMGGKKSL